MAEPARPAMFAAQVVLAVARGLARVLPSRLRKALDDRFFGAVFHATRVTNDAYGWRPPESSPSSGEGSG
jgi:hypothetical protein